MNDYQGYLQSDAWRSRHKRWLELCDNRDLLFPWRRIGQVGRIYYPYSMHHMNMEAYECKGSESIFWHIAPLSRRTHDNWMHNRLSDGIPRVGQQDVFPTKWQWIANQICRFNFCWIQLLRLFKYFWQFRQF